MKSSIKCLILGIALMQTAKAAAISSLSLPNLTGGAGDVFVINAVGDRLATGFVGLGGFGISDAEVDIRVSNSDYGFLISNFTPFIGTDNFVDGITNAFGFVAGAYAISVANFDVTGRTGQTLYSFMGNAANLTDSTELALFKHNGTLAADPANPPESEYNLNLVAGALLIGSPTTTVISDVALTLDEATVDAVQLTSLNIVPEPSTVLLSALGVLGLLRRKR